MSRRHSGRVDEARLVATGSHTTGHPATAAPGDEHRVRAATGASQASDRRTGVRHAPVGNGPPTAGVPEPTSRPDPTAAFADVRRLTEELAAPLSAEDQTVQSMPDVSPTKWHRAHVTWFFETFVLERFAGDHRPVEPAYRQLFNSYYDGVGPQFTRGHRGLVTRPGIAEVSRYRSIVDGRVTDLLSGAPPDDAAELVELGMHHEQQHQELLLMDIKHVLSINPLRPVYRTQRERDGADHTAHGSPRDVPRLGWVDVDADRESGSGVVEVGHGGERFAFDNEGPRHRVHLNPYRIADRLVTAGEWLAFIDDGGYARAELWLSDGWHAARDEGWEAPLYWNRSDGDDHCDWVVHTLGGTRPIDPAAPVTHVSHYEADAYARWAGARLPTEAEWEHAAVVSDVVAARPFEVTALEPAPASAAPAMPGSLLQMHGECWQWTSSAYLPYPGFRPAAGAVGEYNGKFMSGQMVLRGSSSFTPPGHARDTYRNFFPPHSRWMLSGVRLADGGHPTR